MQLRDLLWIVATSYLCLFPYASAAAASHPACEPAAGIESTLQQFSMAAGERARGSGNWDAFESALTAEIERHPSSVYLQRRYQDLHNANLEGLVAHYSELAAANPEDPAYLYLYGRILGLLERKEAEAPLLEALRVDPHYPWAHLALGRVYEVNLPDPDKAQFHIAAFIEACPTSRISLGRLRNVSDPDVAKKVAANVRAAFASDPDPSAAAHLQAVWTAEFKALPPSEHSAVRDRVRHDLELLSKLDAPDDPRILQALLEGYTLVGDDEGLNRTIEVMAQRFPRDPNARRAAMRQFHERHPSSSPGDGSPESDAYGREYSAATQRWCEMWPDDPEVWLARFDALSSTGGVPTEILLATADTLLKIVAKRPDFQTEPLVQFQIARAFVERGVALDRVPGWVEQGLQQLEAGKPRIEGGGPEAALVISQIEQMLAYQGWIGREALFDAYLKKERLDEAGAALAEMERLLPSDTSGGGGDWEQMQFLHLRASWLKRCAALALSESRTVDALLYQNAALTLEPASEDLPLDDMAELWRGLGASEEAVRTWSTSGTQLPVVIGQHKELALPEFEFQDLAGRTWRLSDLRGQVVLINVWATWCAPCTDELPVLQKLHERMQDVPGMVLLTLNVDENPGVVEPIMRRSGYNFPVVFAYDYMLDLWGYQWAIPTTYIVGPQGMVRRELSGFDIGDEQGPDKVLHAMKQVAREAQQGG